MLWGYRDGSNMNVKISFNKWGGINKSKSKFKLWWYVGGSASELKAVSLGRKWFGLQMC